MTLDFVALSARSAAPAIPNFETRPLPLKVRAGLNAQTD
jgi:hypothetical protein